jgi:hypothetical protein
MMSKSVGLLLLLALALGLWVSLNPEAHQKAAQSWEDAKTFFLAIQTNLSVATHNWLVGLKAGEKDGAEKIGAVWNQISSAFAAWWDSAHRFWLHLTAGVRIKAV